MLVATALVVLVGVAAMLAIGGRIAENRLDDRVEDVTRDFDTSLNRFRDEVRRELEARGTQGQIPVTPTPFSTPTPGPTTTPEEDGSATATPSPTTSPDDSLPDPESTPGDLARP